MRRLVSCIVVVVLAAGCASAPDTDPTIQPTSTATYRGSERTLAQLGFRHGPVAAIAIPDDAQVSVSTDQFNVVTAVFTHPSPAVVVDFLRTHLQAGGFTISADKNQSLIFSGHGWDGAFTVGADGQSALTLRLSGH